MPPNVEGQRNDWFSRSAVFYFPVALGGIEPSASGTRPEKRESQKVSNDKIAISKSNGNRHPSPESMSDEGLGTFVAVNLENLAVAAETLKPYYLELRERFAKKESKSATINGCRTWDEYCNKVLERTRRAVNYFLAGGNPVSKRTQPKSLGGKRFPTQPEYPTEQQREDFIEIADPPLIKIPNLVTALLAVSNDGRTVNEAADIFWVSAEWMRKAMRPGGKKWLDGLIDQWKAAGCPQTETETAPTPRAVVDPLVSVIQQEAPQQSVNVQMIEREPEPATVVHVETAPEPDQPPSQDVEEFRENIYERPEDQEPERSKPQYELILTVEGYRIDAVKKKAQEDYGKNLVSVEKINYGASRQDQLADALDQIENAKADIQSLRDEMQNILDNTPDNLKGSDKYSEREECVEALDSLIGDLENIDGSSIEFPGMY